jgi:MFS family permease
VTVIFVVLGLNIGSMASRVPAIKSQLHLSTGSLGIALLGSAIGSVLSTPVSGRVLTRIAPRRWISLGLVPFTMVLPLATLAGGRWTLLAVLFGEGFGMGCVDVAMNTEATRVQALLGRRVLSGIHATFSLGALAGAGIGALAAVASIGFAAQFIAVGAVILIGGNLAVTLLPDTPARAETAAGQTAGPGPEPSGGGQPSGGRPSGGRPIGGRSWPRMEGPILALAVIAFGDLLAEGATNDWSAVYIHNSLGAPAAVSALGYAAFAATMVLARLTGDRVTTRYGAVRVVRAASLLGASGLGVALLIGATPVAIVGFGLLGVGLAVTFPLAITAASGIGTAAPSVAFVTSAGYLGLLCGPPLIGGLATVTSLPVALGLPVALCLLLALLAGQLRRGAPTAFAATGDVGTTVA